MKNKMVVALIPALLNLWIPYAVAETSRELDPNFSPDPQASSVGEGSWNAPAADPAGTVSDAAADTLQVEKTLEERQPEEAPSKKEKKGKKEKKDKKSKKQTSKKTSGNKGKHSGSKKHKKNAQ